MVFVVKQGSHTTAPDNSDDDDDDVADDYDNGDGVPVKR